MTAQLWAPPAVNAVIPESPLTVTGGVTATQFSPVGMPSPSWPLRSLPQQRAVRSASSAQA
jgi:hypothetical protein